VITISLFSLFRLGVKPYQKPDDEGRASLWNTEWSKQLDVDFSVSGLYRTLVTGHIYHATEITDYFPSTCFKGWTSFGEIQMHISANLCTVHFKQCVMKVLWKLTWKGIVLCAIYLSYTLSNYHLLLCVHNWWSYIICTSTYVFFVCDICKSEMSFPAACECNCYHHHTGMCILNYIVQCPKKQ